MRARDIAYPLSYRDRRIVDSRGRALLKNVPPIIGYLLMIDERRPRLNITTAHIQE